ncbi:MAG: multiheme c-type cytochrome [Planctomycetaceae bacterium]
MQTANDEPAQIDLFFSNADCAVCHPRQDGELRGSMHSAAHTDPLYRSFAETARKEAGPKVYAYCSGCHSATGLVSGLIPDAHDDQLPDEAKVGVSCDVCHSISSLTGHSGPWKEPGNASFVLEQGRAKYSSLGEVMPNRRHTGDKRDFFAKSEFCASCHTVIHPVNGVRIEHTYGEWKGSVYAKKGIQCQDCHMNSVADAIKVAETLQPIVVEGRSASEGPLRKVRPHYFVGGNSNAETLAGGKEHARIAVERLKSAARLELVTPQSVRSGKPISCDVLVHNIGAGHNIPSGVTELREMWVDLRIIDQSGKVLFQNGKLDADGKLPQNAIRFGALATDAKGNHTYKLWEVTKLAWKRTIPPKEFSHDTVTAALPEGVRDKVTIEARLLYRSASPDVVKQFMGDKAFEPQVVEMTRAAASVAVE